MNTRSRTANNSTIAHAKPKSNRASNTTDIQSCPAMNTRSRTINNTQGGTSTRRIRRNRDGTVVPPTVPRETRVAKDIASNAIRLCAIMAEFNDVHAKHEELINLERVQVQELERLKKESRRPGLTFTEIDVISDNLKQQTATVVKLDRCINAYFIRADKLFQAATDIENNC